MKNFWEKIKPSRWLARKNEETLTPQGGFKLAALEFIKLALFAFITIFLVRYFLFKPFYVRGASMEPNFFDKEYLIIDEITYRWREPQRGEIIVFRYPGNRKEYFLKRIIALPGERVKIKNGGITIYNQEYPDGFVLDENIYLPPGLQNKPDVSYTLDNQHYFVMGDNRGSSFDSRYFGPVNKSEVVGRVFLRGWPLNRLRVFNKVLEYNNQ